MNYKTSISQLLLFSLAILFIACNGQSKNETASDSSSDNKSNAGAKEFSQKLSKGKGSLSFKLDGKLYETNPQRTKCWSTSSVPLAMLMSYGDGLQISWQMGYQEGNDTYKLDGDDKGNVNFTIGEKTYWTRSVTGDNYLNIKITNVKDQYNVKLLSGTFEGVLEDKDGNKVQITEGQFVTESI